MATTKQATKKPVSKTATAKKAVAHKAPVKRATTVRTKRATKQSDWELPSGGHFKSFKLGKVHDFFSVRVTDQTVYWAILSFVVLALGIWVITIDDRLHRLYDQIDFENSDNSYIIKK